MSDVQNGGDGDGQIDSGFRVDFIDPLFAVAIHIGVVEGFMQTPWDYSKGLMGWAWINWVNARYMLPFMTGIWLLATSWVGYHRSIKRCAIKGDARFILDIALLLIYITVLVKFSDDNAFRWLIFLAFALYIAWDYYKTVEYETYFYKDRTKPWFLGYVLECQRSWYGNGEGGLNRGGVITFVWAVYFGVLLLAVPALVHIMDLLCIWKSGSVEATNFAGICTATLTLIGIHLYRSDKKIIDSTVGHFAFNSYTKIGFPVAAFLSFVILML